MSSEGQQSKLAALFAEIDAAAEPVESIDEILAANYTVAVAAGSAPAIESVAALAARVRADVAEEIGRAIEMSCECSGETDPHIVDACEYRAAARIARDHAAAPAESVVGAPTPATRHPEDDCHRCGRSLAIPWAAPSPLWNAVMRGGSINGEELFDGIVCPTCFAQLAQERGIAEVWHFDAARVLVPLETVTPSGRVWDEQAWLWREPVGAVPEDEGTRQEGLINVEE